MSLTQRSHAEDYWGNSGQPRSQHGHTNSGLGSKLESFMDKKELPMYNDKPYNYAGSRKQTPLYRQKLFIGGAILVLIWFAYWFGIFSPSVAKPKLRETNKGAWNWLSSPTASAPVDWDDRRESEGGIYTELGWLRTLCMGYVALSRSNTEKFRLFVGDISKDSL